MRVFMKKAACFLSAAVLLCGATAIPASAANPASFVGATSTQSMSVLGVNFYIDGGSFELADGASKTVTVKRCDDMILSANATVSYQWYKDGTAVSGATSASYPIKALGKYYCKVTVKTPHTLINRRTGKKTIYTTEEYDTSAITVTQALTITDQPEGGTIDSDKGYFDMFVYVKGGTAPYKFKWYWNGKETSLTGNGMRVYNAGTGYCVITDANGKTVTTKTVKVTAAPLKIASQPESGYICTSDGYYDTYVSVNGGVKPYTYKWMWNGNETSVTGSSIRFYGTGTAYCVITDARGNKVTTNTINIKKTDELKITKDITECDNREILYDSKTGEYRATAIKNTQDVTLSIKAAGGTGRYKYEWECTDYDGYSEEWIPTGGSSNVINIKDFDVYDSYIYSWSTNYKTRNYRKYRCKVSCLDDYGNVLSTVTSGVVRVEGYDSYGFGGF